jgi:hypothetical protein
MNKFTSLLIVCSLALAGAAMAQQPEEQASPKNQKEAPVKTEKAEPKTPKAGGENAAKPEAMPKTHTAETKSGANLASPEATAPTQHGAKIERPAKVPKTDTAVKSEKSAGTETGVSAQTSGGATTETGTGKGRKGRTKAETTTSTGTDVSGQPTASATPGGKHQAGQHEKGLKAGGANAKTPATPATAATASTAPVTAASASVAPVTAASASAVPSVATTGVTGQQTTGANANVAATTGAATTHVEKEKVQQVKQQTAQIKQQHVNFKAQQRADRVPPVTFTVNYRIQGSDRWSGPQYEAFRAYRSERHDRNWYHSRYHRVELIAGGYYYFNNGYWYPAWGYDTGNEYYAYDAPIYVGHRAEPPDRVIADVQAELQQMGYYQGEVDGLTGPLTREALAAYQADQGLQVTAVMDEPTLDSLGMG